MKQYIIKEIFGPTIQGEGTSFGVVVNFIRFSGCNRWTGKEEDRNKDKTFCKFCDTDFANGTKMTIDDVITGLKLLKSKAKVIVISGGEPSLQIDEEFLQALTAEGYELHIETNGSKSLKGLEKYLTHITCSPKQSLEQTKLERCDDLKILYPFISEEITWEKFKSMEHKQAFLQPLWGTEPLQTIEFMYQNPELKISLQQHKLLGVE